jgi:hypothetical protein
VRLLKLSIWILIEATDPNITNALALQWMLPAESVRKKSITIAATCQQLNNWTLFLHICSFCLTPE